MEKKTYENFYKLYLRIFKKLGIPIFPVKAPSGEIGGNLSHEFHLIVSSGESEIHVDQSLFKKDINNFTISEIKSINSFTDDLFNKDTEIKNLKKFKSIELGHIFYLVTSIVNRSILLLIQIKIKFIHLWVRMELEYQEFQQL